MDEKTWIGSSAESKALHEYTKAGWDVFTQTTGKAPFDLVVHQEHVVRRIQVKGCNSHKNDIYVTQLRSIRSNRTGNVIKFLDPDSYDELAIYIVPQDKMYFLWPEEVNGRSYITFNFNEEISYREYPGDAHIE